MELAYLTSLALARNSLMQPATIICDNSLGLDAPCGQPALVYSVQYIYGRHPNGGRLAANSVLLEAHFAIECPRCGRRTQVERYE